MNYGENVKIGYSLEHINLGDSMYTLTIIRRSISGIDEESVEIIQKIYDIIIKAGSFSISDIMLAEASKVIENRKRSQHYLHE